MTVISRHGGDDTKIVARRFAALAMSYLDDPAKARGRTAKIPLQNIYRLLEMYRYDAFADEGRRGVLALDRLAGAPAPHKLPTAPQWHVEIKKALKSAVDSTYAEEKDVGPALDEVEGDLKALAQNGALSADRTEKVRKFLKKFESSLA